MRRTGLRQKRRSMHFALPERTNNENENELMWCNTTKRRATASLNMHRSGVMQCQIASDQSQRVSYVRVRFVFVFYFVIGIETISIRCSTLIAHFVCDSFSLRSPITVPNRCGWQTSIGHSTHILAGFDRRFLIRRLLEPTKIHIEILMVR